MAKHRLKRTNIDAIAKRKALAAEMEWAKTDLLLETLETRKRDTVKALLKTGLLGVAKKGELQWGHAVDPVQATKTLEAA